MSPTETSHATSGARSRLIALGAECELRSCGACGRALLAGASCGCARAPRGRARLRLSLVESLESKSVAPATADLGRLACRGEVIA